MALSCDGGQLQCLEGVDKMCDLILNRWQLCEKIIMFFFPLTCFNSPPICNPGLLCGHRPAHPLPEDACEELGQSQEGVGGGDEEHEP